MSTLIVLRRGPRDVAREEALRVRPEAYSDPDAVALD
jgi:hypothetical protein